MRLGDLKEFLEGMPQDGVIKHGFGRPNTSRGDYSDCAFEPAQDVTVASMLAHVERALSGEVFEGYKGGDYTFGEHTSCYIDEWGEWNDNAISPQLCGYWESAMLPSVAPPSSAEMGEFEPGSVWRGRAGVEVEVISMVEVIGLNAPRGLEHGVLYALPDCTLKVAGVGMFRLTFKPLCSGDDIFREEE